MDIRKIIIALAVLPVLGLFTTFALADVSGPPAASANATNFIFDEQIKNRGQCGDATFFKNAFPSLTNGTPGGSTTIDFTVDGKIVPMTVTWFEDNSFNFAIDGGWASRVGVTVDTNNFVYEYSSPTVGIDDPEDGFTDTQLNYYGGGVTADDVNHLDLCLKTLDSTAPDVSIRVEPSSDGATISGIVSIIATVIDESDVDVAIEIVNADGDPVILDNVVPSQSGNEFTWTWDTTTVPSGEYTITVNATDTSAFANFTTASITVTVSIENCLEGADGLPAGQIGIGGCNPSGFQIIELPEELRDSGLLDGETLTQYAVPVLLGQECVGPAAPFAGRDPRLGELVAGEYNARDLDLSEVFDVAPGVAVMRSDTRGVPCLALIFGEATFSFADFYDPITNVSLFGANRYTYGITQLPEAEDLGLPIPADVGPLGADQIDLQKVPEATYQPTDRNLVTFVGNRLGPFTNDVFNPQRAKVPDFSYYVLGTVQICESLLGSGLSPIVNGLPYRPYYEAVLECSTDLAVEYFDDLDELLAYYGTSSPEYPEACLISPSVENLRVELNKARSMIKVGDWTKADKRLDDLLIDIKQGIWLVDDRNCPGHAVMRVENLLWRNAQLELAESLLP